MLNPNDDLYEILGISRDATLADIKSAFRRLAKKYHPDANGNADGTKFARVSAAYAILKDPKAKHEYDTTGRIKEAGPTEEQKVEEVLVQAFEAVIDRTEDVGEADLVKTVRGLIVEQVVRTEKAISQGTNEVRKITGVLKRLRSRRKDDMVICGIQAMKEKHLRGIESAQDKQAFMTKALERLGDLEFQRDELQPEQRMYTNTITWSST